MALLTLRSVDRITDDILLLNQYICGIGMNLLKREYYTRSSEFSSGMYCRVK